MLSLARHQTGPGNKPPHCFSTHTSWEHTYWENWNIILWGLWISGGGICNGSWEVWAQGLRCPQGLLFSPTKHVHSSSTKVYYRVFLTKNGNKHDVSLVMNKPYNNKIRGGGVA